MNIHDESKAKNIYSLIAVCMGLVFAVFGFLVLTQIFRFFGISLSFGHAGEAASYFLSLFVNTFLTLIAVFVGRVVIGWKPIQW